MRMPHKLKLAFQVAFGVWTALSLIQWAIALYRHDDAGIIFWGMTGIAAVVSAFLVPMAAVPSVKSGIPRSTWAELPLSCVYVVQDKGKSRCFKIGRTSNLYSRMRQYETSLAESVHLVHYVPTGHPKEVERRLHRTFAPYRAKGEWFALDSIQFEALKAIMDEAATQESGTA